MGGLEFNKIFAAILVAGIVASLSGFIAGHLVHPDYPEEDAYPIEEAEGGGAGAGPQAVPMPDPILPLIAEADPARGEQIAKSCTACHTFNKGGPNGVGPNLYNVVYAPKDAHPDFAYSGALEETEPDNWTYAALNHWLWKPKEYAPGTKMNFIGLKKPEDRAAVIAWMRQQADAPHPLPTDAEIAAEAAELAPPEPEGAEAADADLLESGTSTPDEMAPAKESESLSAQ